MPTEPSIPKLSVIVASQNARANVRACLDALALQTAGDELELVIVDNSTDGTAEIIARDFPHLRQLAAPSTAYIPELWEMGIRQSAGEIVALTTSHFIPAADWVARMLRAHDSPYVGIGGAIENDANASLVDWAIYFCRYSPFMLPFAAHEVTNFAGDNASYKRAAIDRCQEARRRGFWEPEIHAEFVRLGWLMFLTPEVIVRHGRSFSFAGFCQQRFWHGRQFGMTRAAQLSATKRVAYILLSPLIPAIFLFRITRAVVTKRRHVGWYLLSLPLLLLFLLSWSAGELSGYLQAIPSYREAV